MDNNFKQLCVWQGTMLGKTTAKEFEEFFKEQGFSVKFAEEVITNPDLDEFGAVVPGTGGRHDLLFYIAEEDVMKFAIPRLAIGIRWWEDVVSYNDGAHLYSDEVLNRYPVNW